MLQIRTGDAQAPPPASERQYVTLEAHPPKLKHWVELPAVPFEKLSRASPEHP